MSKILGIDLGTNSIGWAIRDISVQNNQIVDKGVLTFEKGVAEGKSGEFPMVQKRTESRGKRRNYQAEKYRKWQLLQTLIENQMCPLTIDELNGWRHYQKGVGRKYPQTERFIQWLRFDFDGDGKPDFKRFGFDKHESLYVFRMLAGSEDDVSKVIFKREPYLLGRVLYQLVQRRGFRGRDEEESKTIMQGGGDSSAKGANEITPYIKKYGTLGAALYHLQKETGERIRKRYNLRSDYEQELKTISKIHAFTDDVYKSLWKAIVWQRPLRSQKGLLGACTFDKSKRRAPVSHPFYEEYRTWVFINNLKINFPVNTDKEAYLSKNIYPLFYNSTNDFKLKKLIDRLRKDGYTIDAKFNDNTKVISCTLLNNLKKLLGDNWKEQYAWYDVLENKSPKQGYTFEDIWHVLATFDSKEKLEEFAKEKLSLSDEKAKQFSKIRLMQGYATLSLSAIKKMLPYLRKGIKYSHAVYLANMQKVLGTEEVDAATIDHLIKVFDKIRNEHKRESQISEILNGLIADHQNAVNRWGMSSDYYLDEDDQKDILQKILSVVGEKSWNVQPANEKKLIQDTVTTNYEYYLQQRIYTPLNKVFSKISRLHDRLFDYLKNRYELPDKNIKYLWHPSEQENYLIAKEKNGFRLLGDPQPVSRGFKNPMALKTLHQLKKLLNSLIQSEKIDEDTRIVVEIARELNDANRRKAIERWQREREKENEDYKKKIQEIFDQCNVDYAINQKLLNKYRLWMEQGQVCLYTGKLINFCDCFDGSKYDLEHTVPASMSFDNELKNLTLADATYNRQVKGNKLPTELFNYYEDANGYTAIKPRLKFLEEKVENLKSTLDEWIKKTSDDKKAKDAIIQRRHMIRMDLDYWYKKLDTFKINEYKAGWRNSQLRDTQLITKYALPYLKTVFKRVDVQKGSVTAIFREIYKIQPRLENKDRSKHSHHAIDAAILTLIPPASIRDAIILRYNQQLDTNSNITYHEPVRDWSTFKTDYVLSIEEDVLINFQPHQRALTHTYKNVRKRGRQQFVKKELADGKWQYKLDTTGEKIPLKAIGDTIRGKLHKESFFGAVKLDGEKWLVERYPVAAFTKIEDCKNIVDAAVRKIVEEALRQRMEQGLTFDKAKLDPIPFPSGKAVIKKVRCKVAAGRGYLTPAKALEIRKHDFKSKHEYKNNIYAQNDENTLCLYYEEEIDGRTERAFRIVGLFELAQLKLANVQEIRQEAYYKTISAGRGKVKVDIHLAHIIQVGTKVIFYKENADELKNLPIQEVISRTYRVYKFNEVGSPYIYLQYHLESRPNDLLGDGDTQFDPAKYQCRLKLKADKFSCIIENKHFEVLIDGTIKLLF